LRVALGMSYTDPDVPQQAIQYYVQYAQQVAADPSKGISLPGGSDDDVTPFAPGTGVAFVQNAADGIGVGHSLDFGAVSLGGAGNGVSLVLVNIGDKPLNVSSGSLTGSSQFSISGLAAQVLAPGASVPFTLTFSPTRTGPDSAHVVLANN